MSVARTTEISASSKKSFEDAIHKGIKRCAQTIDNVEGAWVKEQKVVIKDGEVSAYRVTMKVSFVLKD
jgi:flavin-binding protein dodecin